MNEIICKKRIIIIRIIGIMKKLKDNEEKQREITPKKKIIIIGKPLHTHTAFSLSAVEAPLLPPMKTSTGGLV